jgi:hypothetical protein
VSARSTIRLIDAATLRCNTPGQTEPDALLLDFLSTTYAAAADCGGWDRATLECPFGVPGRVRPV